MPKIALGKRWLTALSYGAMLVPIFAAIGSVVGPILGIDATMAATSFGMSAFGGAIGIALAEDMKSESD